MVGAARAHLADIGGLTADFVKFVEREVDAGFMGNSR